MFGSHWFSQSGNRQPSLRGTAGKTNNFDFPEAYSFGNPMEYEALANRGQRSSHYAEYTTRPEIMTAETGILSGTCLDTPEGPTPIENLRVGDKVMTFDDGLQQIRSISRSWVRPNAALGEVSRKFVWIDNGAVGNSLPLLLLPGQPIMIESDLAESVLGDPFAVVAADTLVGTDCSEYVAVSDPVEIYNLTFDRSQLVYCAEGALVWFGGEESLRAGGDQEDRYEVFKGRFGQLLTRVGMSLTRTDGSPLRNLYAAETGAVSVDFVILTAAAAGLGAVMLSIVGSGGVDLAQRIGDFLANMPLTTF